ncbi:MAG: Dickkopf N-terminal cysteine-rich domain-containing protein [Myxococcales bacterium]
MMHRGGWIFCALLLVACGGRSRNEEGTASAGGGSSSTGSGGAGSGGAGSGGASAARAGSAGSCPDDSAEPSEGAACPAPGLSCPGYGNLACPLTAVCNASSSWEVHCSSMMLFGPCSCPHPDPDRVPKEHRAAALTCSHTRAPNIEPGESGCVTSDGSPCPNSQCNHDSDCTDATQGANGRCVETGPIFGFSCSYDTCFADADCGNGSVCQCREPADSVTANYCTAPLDCRVDGDCGVHGYCSPSQAHEWCGTFYACHTLDDECTDDSDCGSGTHCDFDRNAHHWVCGNLCGAVPP